MSKLRTKQRRAARRRQEWQQNYREQNPVVVTAQVAKTDLLASVAQAVDPKVVEHNRMLNKAFYDTSPKYLVEKKERADG